MPSYSAEEKKNALRLCDKIGVSKASKETGISRHTLYIWRAGAEDEIVTTTAVVDADSVEEMIKEKTANPTRKRYTTEEKENALLLCKEIGMAKASKKTGISVNLLYKWRSGAKDEITTDVANGNPPDEATAKEKMEPNHEITSAEVVATGVAVSTMEKTADELIHLRIENAALKAQIVTLKKALRVFTDL